ncbi:hypothetical protein GGI21_002485 [Coemansia aciculifera]|nr:hypothetical protein GGI21_002485 [Coemansia aciculifera]
MGRKKSNASKKGKSKQPSRNHSPTSAAKAIGAGSPEGEGAVVAEPTQASINGDEQAKEELENSPDSGKYAIDVAAELADPGVNAATEDQLEDPIVYAVRNDDEEHSAGVAGGERNDVQPQLHIPDHTTRVSGSVNMEDSQAELLSSNMDHSMYRSLVDHGVHDELHALESKVDSLACLADDSVDVAAAAAFAPESSGNVVARPYVISPSNFAESNRSEADEVVYLRPDSATGPTVQESAESGAAAVASIVASLVEAAAAAGLSISTSDVAREAIESSGELLGEHGLYSSIGQVSGGHSIADSYVHVDGSDNGDGCEHTKEQTTDLDRDSESDCDIKADEQVT